MFISNCFILSRSWLPTKKHSCTSLSFPFGFSGKNALTCLLRIEEKKKMPLGKPTFLHMSYLENRAKSSEKDRILHIHLNKPACKIWSCFGNVQF